MSYTMSVRPPAPVRRRIKATVYVRERGACFWCDAPLSVEESTLDHIVTAGRGGQFVPGNLVLACFSCNNVRGDMPADDFLLHRFQIGAQA